MFPEAEKAESARAETIRFSAYFPAVAPGKGQKTSHNCHTLAGKLCYGKVREKGEAALKEDIMAPYRRNGGAGQVGANGRDPLLEEPAYRYTAYNAPNRDVSGHLAQVDRDIKRIQETQPGYGRGLRSFMSRTDAKIAQWRESINEIFEEGRRKDWEKKERAYWEGANQRSIDSDLGEIAYNPLPYPGSRARDAASVAAIVGMSNPLTPAAAVTAAERTTAVTNDFQVWWERKYGSARVTDGEINFQRIPATGNKKETITFDLPLQKAEGQRLDVRQYTNWRGQQYIRVISSPPEGVDEKPKVYINKSIPRGADVVININPGDIEYSGDISVSRETAKLGRNQGSLLLNNPSGQPISFANFIPTQGQRIGLLNEPKESENQGRLDQAYANGQMQQQIAQAKQRAIEERNRARQEVKLARYEAQTAAAMATSVRVAQYRQQLRGMLAQNGVIPQAGRYGSLEVPNVQSGQLPPQRGGPGNPVPQAPSVGLDL